MSPLSSLHYTKFYTLTDFFFSSNNNYNFFSQLDVLFFPIGLSKKKKSKKRQLIFYKIRQPPR